MYSNDTQLEILCSIIIRGKIFFSTGSGFYECLQKWATNVVIICVHVAFAIPDDRSPAHSAASPTPGIITGNKMVYGTVTLTAIEYKQEYI